MNSDTSEARLSSRPLKVAKVVSYGDEANIELPPLCKKGQTNSSKRYMERKPHEMKVATTEKRANAMKRAEQLLSSFQSDRPSFIRSMIKSQVYTCYWLGIPTPFCKDHLPSNDQKIILENELGEECETNFLAGRSGLSGGWRGFALKHKLHDGDAVVFELTELARFKVYIVRAHDDLEEYDAVELADTTNVSDKSMELANSIEENAAPKPQVDCSTKRSQRKPNKPNKSADGICKSLKRVEEHDTDDVILNGVEEHDIDDVILNGVAEATNNQGDEGVVASETEKQVSPKKIRSVIQTKLFRKRRTWA